MDAINLLGVGVGYERTMCRSSKRSGLLQAVLLLAHESVNLGGGLPELRARSTASGVYLLRHCRTINCPLASKSLHLAPKVRDNITFVLNIFMEAGSSDTCKRSERTGLGQ